MGSCCAQGYTISKKVLSIEDITKENLLLLGCLIMNFISKKQKGMAIKLIKIEYITRLHYNKTLEGREAINKKESRLETTEIESFHKSLDKEMAQLLDTRNVLLNKYKEETKIWFTPDRDTLIKFQEEIKSLHQKTVLEVFHEASISIQNNSTHEVAIKFNGCREFTSEQEAFLLDICKVTTHIYTNNKRIVAYPVHNKDLVNTLLKYQNISRSSYLTTDKSF